MPEYKVQHSYASNHNGRRFGPWTAGDVVDVDVADAEWVNRDSPDTLAGSDVEPEPVDQEPDANPEPVEPELVAEGDVVDVDTAEPKPEAKPPVKRARR